MSPQSGERPRPERRRAPRVTERISLTLAGADGVVQAQTQNLSAAGAYCTLDRFIPPMTKLELQLELPDGQQRTALRCTGVVVRVEPLVTTPQHGRYQTAILFTELSEQGRSAIERFVVQQLAKRPLTP